MYLRFRVWGDIYIYIYIYICLNPKGLIFEYLCFGFGEKSPHRNSYNPHTAPNTSAPPQYANSISRFIAKRGSGGLIIGGMGLITEPQGRGFPGRGFR